MSKLEKLIEELCPDGVEYKKLGEVILSLNTGLNPRKFFKLNTEDARNYYVTIREIQNNSICFTEKTDRINDEAMILCNKRSNLEIGDILFSGTGTIGETAIINKTPLNWNIKEGVYAIKSNKEYLEPKFLMYLLKGREVRQIYMKKVVGGTVKSIPMKELRQLEIPVPPLPVQEEIVRILDSFTEKTNELKAKLEEELEARKKQYEWYRDSLLKFDESVPSKPLEKVLKIKNGKDYKHLNSGNVPVYGSGGIMTFVDTAMYDKPSVLIPRKGSISNLYYVDVPFWNVDTIFYTEINISIVNPKFVYYYLQTQKLEKLNKAGGVPSLTQSVLNKVKIPLPPLEEQQRIVDILDRFDKLCNDISEGLPAEIDARQKQYEYYRDKLLTFKRLEDREGIEDERV